MAVVSLTTVPGPERGPGDLMMNKLVKVPAWSLMREISKIIMCLIVYSITS